MGPDQTPITPELKFYFEDSRDVRRAEHLCIELGLSLLNNYIRNDYETYAGFGPDTLGLMGLMGINPKDFFHYDAGRFWVSIPDDIEKLRKMLGREGDVDSPKIIDYVFRCSVLSIIDTISWGNQQDVFDNLRRTLSRDQIDPAWVYEAMFNMFITPGIMKGGEEIMAEIMPRLAEAYVATIAYPRGN